MYYRISGMEKTLPVMAFARRGQRGGSGGQVTRCWQWKDENQGEDAFEEFGLY